MESPFQKPQPSKRWTLVIIVTFLVGIVAIPVCSAYWPSERARWLLAAAENAWEKSKKTDDEWSRKAHNLLEHATASSPEIQNSIEFVRLRLDMLTVNEDVARVIELIRTANPKFQASMANSSSEKWAEDRDFDAAYKILLAGYPSPAKRSALERNQLAYYAALAGRDLEPALADIEIALTESENSAYQDTKAWVLFKLDRHEEALAMIDQALAKFESELNSVLLPASVKKTIRELREGKGPFHRRPLDDNTNTLATLNRDLANSIKILLVYHYHRGEILEALGRIEEADQEYSWLEDRGFHDFDELY